MIFDFISGEASTQEGGEKFAKWLAEDTDLTQKEKKSVVEKIKDFFTKLLDAVRSVIEGQSTLNTTARAGQKAAQQVPVLDDFFNALDNAIDNRQRMLDGEQRNTTDDKSSTGIRFSKDLDQYPYDMQTVIKKYLFFKKINGTYYVAESTVDSKWKKAWVTSVYINKNRHGYLSTNMAVTPHQFTPETPLRSPVSANTKVSLNGSGVNIHSMQNGQKMHRTAKITPGFSWKWTAKARK